MGPRIRRVLTLVILVAVAGCHRDAPVAEGPRATLGSPDPTEQDRPRKPLLGDEIPSGELDAVVSAHLQGLGHMERYEYDKAVQTFRAVHERAPGWIAGSINLAIALLNGTGAEVERSRTDRARSDAVPPRFQEALSLLDEVLSRDPTNLPAHYCRGIIREDLGDLHRAHHDFLFVTEHDPDDAHAWYKVGSTLTDPERPDRPAGPKQARRLIEVYSKALELNPNLVSVVYKLQAAYGWAGERDRQAELIRRWQELDPGSNAAGPGDTVGTGYGELGRYARIINPNPASPVVEEPARFPRFSLRADPIAIDLPAGCRWVKSSDFEGALALIGRARARFGAAVATFDADGDGTLDLYLCSAVKGPRGVRDALLINHGERTFADATEEFGLSDDHASLGVAAGDFDADGKLDLFVTGVGTNRLYRNAGARFEDVTSRSGIVAVPAVSLTARWLDLDQDGDLDLYVVNHAAAEEADACFGERSTAGLRNAAYRNDGKPPAIAGRPSTNWAPTAVAPADLPASSGLSVAFTAWPVADALCGEPAPNTAIAALDLDDDRDVDLVLAADGRPLRAVLNDRLGKFHAIAMEGALPPGRVSGLLVTDLDKDGRADLVSVAAEGAVIPWRNATERLAAGRKPSWEPWPTDAKRWACAVAADLDLDTWPDVVGISRGRRGAAIACARNEGTRLAEQMPWGRPEPGPGSDPSPTGFALADLVGDALPDLLIVADGAPPRIARNLGNGRHWLALDLSGRWKAGADHMRTNPHGLGARVALEGQGLNVQYDHTTPAAGLGQGVGPVVLGMDRSPSAALLRVRWPDGTLQCELNVPADQVLGVVEHNRKTSSCPVLFAWDGARFACLGDFLGGGGLGYLVAPGVSGRPDRDEAVAIAPGQLASVAGAYRLVVAEPMDEVAYLDQLSLDVVDRPAEVSVAPDERFAPGGNRPSGDLVAWRTAIEPVSATDLDGRDVADRLRSADRKSVDGFRRLGGWIGYAEEHGIVLDFGDRLAPYGPDTSLWLGLAGWVEYPYSQTNYAAATAGVVLRPPTVERQRNDGSWAVIEPDAGYPAGLPRLTLLDLSGKLSGPHCVIRLRTNMECYWDHAFVAVRDRAAEAVVRVASLPVAQARLGYRGFTREASPDGRLPLLYDYDQVEPAPLARMSGRLTRYGDVARLLRADDDQLCLLGPGDELRLEFDAGRAPVLPVGWTRSFVLRAVGYCKDADPFTAASDDVGPLPWRGMPAYPFGLEGERPHDPAYAGYLREYLTRPAGGR